MKKSQSTLLHSLLLATLLFVPMTLSADPVPSEETKVATAGWGWRGGPYWGGYWGRPWGGWGYRGYWGRPWGGWGYRGYWGRPYWGGGWGYGGCYGGWC